MDVIRLHTCKRCGKKWVPREPEWPKTCPTCKAASWNMTEKERLKLAVTDALDWAAMRQLGIEGEVPAPSGTPLIYSAPWGKLFALAASENETSHDEDHYHLLRPEGQQRSYEAVNSQA